jgi:ethanolamine utilization protein EutA (predicted chaperonin)
LSTFITNKTDGDQSAYLFRFVSDYIVYNTAGGSRRVFAGTNANAGTASSNEELWSTISTLNSSGGTANFFANGTLVSSANANIGTKTVSNRVLNIGGSGSSTHWNGTVNEVIFYATDQTSNRPALDANIISHYGIS